MRNIGLRSYISTVALLFFCSLSLSPAFADDPVEASLIQLIANPAAYDGRFVRVQGFLHHKFEDSALYLSKTDADYIIGRNGVWVSYADKNLSLQADGKKPDLPSFDCKFVLLEGTFYSKGHGHMGLFSGELRSVNRVMKLTRWFDGEKELQKP